jgi:hypothetical protein
MQAWQFRADRRGLVGIAARRHDGNLASHEFLSEHSGQNADTAIAVHATSRRTSARSIPWNKFSVRAKSLASGGMPRNSTAGRWTDGRVQPTAEQFRELVGAHDVVERASRGGQPYPFFLAHPLQA